MDRCSQAGIADAAFAHLRGVHTLLMYGCRQPGITAAALAHLSGISALEVNSCSPALVAAAEALGLPLVPLTAY